MNIEINNIVVKIEDGEFTFNNLGLNGFFEIIDLRAKQDIKGCVKLMLDNLIGIKNIAINGKEVSLEEFKTTSLETKVILQLFRSYANAIEGSVVEESGAVIGEAEKNAELPTD